MRVNPSIVPEFVRLAAASGAAPAETSEAEGYYQAGIIKGVSLCTRGPALGHGFWIDLPFIESVTAAANDNERTKSRFTHPGLCADGMGKALGTIDGAKTVGDRCIGDLSFFKTAHSAPDGDLASYVIGLSKECPESFGLSIVFRHDVKAETEFALANGAEMDVDDDGFPYVNYTNFKSPDKENVNNLPHCRLAELKACDVVDEPAANPDGLFHRQNELLSDGTKLMAYLLGQSADVGQVKTLSSLGVSIAPERLRSFVSSYLASAGLSLVKGMEMSKGQEVKESLSEAPDEKKKEDMPADKPADKEEPCEQKSGEGEKSDSEDPADDKEDSAGDKSKCSSKPDATLQEYCAAFGNADGAQFFMDGVSFKDAQTKSIASLKGQLKERDDKLAAFAKLGVDPVGFAASPDKERDKQNAPAATGDSAYDNRSAFAAAIATPSK